MVYVALLRGINVGGNNKVPMADLKLTFERLGFEHVKTFIASGNVIFTDDRTAAKLAPLIQAAIADEIKVDVPVILRDQNNIAKLVKEVPASWNNTEQRTEVMFLWDEVNSPAVKQQVTINPKIENLIYLPGALVWNIDRQHYKQGSGPKLIKSDFYKKMTARNINTVRKLHELMQS